MDIFSLRMILYNSHKILRLISYSVKGFIPLGMGGRYPEVIITFTFFTLFYSGRGCAWGWGLECGIKVK